MAFENKHGDNQYEDSWYVAFDVVDDPIASIKLTRHKDGDLTRVVVTGHASRNAAVQWLADKLGCRHFTFQSNQGDQVIGVSEGKFNFEAEKFIENHVQLPSSQEGILGYIRFIPNNELFCAQCGQASKPKYLYIT